MERTRVWVPLGAAALAAAAWLLLAEEAPSHGEPEVAVSLPTDGRHAVVLERKSGDDWKPWTDTDLCGDPPLPRQADGGRVRFRRLMPATYRAVDLVCGVASEGFLVRSGQPTGGTLDLSRSGWVSGRVIVPSRESVEGVRVGVREKPAESRRPSPVAVVEEDGTYRFRVGGDRGFLVFAMHPRLGQSPPVEVRDPASDVDLRLDGR